MGGAKKSKTTTPRLNDIAVQSSAYGGPVARGWGTFKVAINLIWYGGFKAVAHVEKQKRGGKGMSGGSTTSTTYTYSASVQMAVCQGPIDSIRGVYRDQSVFTGSGALGSAGLSLAPGALGQAPWGYQTTNFPDQALGYSGTAYLYAADYALNDAGTLPNHSVEVVSSIRIAGLDDADAAEIVSDLLPSLPMWGAGLIGDLTLYSDYCRAANLLVSPVLDAQRSAAEFLTEMLKATNSDVVWSDGVLNFVPYGDTAASANGRTYTPDLTPIYALTDEDFQPEDDGGAAVLTSLKRDADASNYVQVEYLDRSRNYANAVMPGTDQASIDTFGLKKQAELVTLHCICNEDSAAIIAQIIAQKAANLRAEYSFSLPINYCLLDPMDLVSINSGDIVNKLVRIIEIEEGDDGRLDLRVEEMLVGMAHAPLIARQTLLGHANDFDIAPGDATDPLLVNPPRALTGGALEVWIATSGGPYWGGAEVWVSYDGDSYELQETILGKARYGFTTSALASHADPDSASSFNVNLLASGGQLDSGTTGDADNFATLCLVGPEIIAFSHVGLTGPSAYTLDTYLRRGLKGTAASSHASGSPFLRLDDAVVAIPYRDDQVGKTVHVKLRSFNVYQRAFQDLDVVDDYTFVLTPSTAEFTYVTWTEISGKPVAVTDLTGDGKIKSDYVSVQVTGTPDLTDYALTLASAIEDAADGVVQASADIVDLQTYGNASLNKNPAFALWPPADAYPTNWATWAGSAPTLVAGQSSANAAQVAGGAGADAGFVGAAFPTGPGYFILEADIRLVSGSLIGAGLLCQGYDATPTYLTDIGGINFATDADITGAVVGAGTTGKTYRFRKLVRSTTTGITQALLYAMAHWSTHGSTASANSIIFDYVGVRVGNDTETGASLIGVNATVKATAATVLTHDGLLAASLKFTAAMGADPAQAELISTSLGSLIKLIATVFTLSTSVGGTQKNVMAIDSTDVHLFEPLVIDIGTQRLALGPNIGTAADLFIWAGPKTIGLTGMTTANSVFSVSEDGVFYLGRVLGRSIFATLSYVGQYNPLPNDGTTWVDLAEYAIFAVPGGGSWMINGSVVFGTFSAVDGDPPQTFVEIISCDPGGGNESVIVSLSDTPLSSIQYLNKAIFYDGVAGSERRLKVRARTNVGFTGEAGDLLFDFYFVT